jgi:hypothetical protein
VIFLALVAGVVVEVEVRDNLLNKELLVTIMAMYVAILDLRERAKVPDSKPLEFLDKTNTMVLYRVDLVRISFR